MKEAIARREPEIQAKPEAEDQQEKPGTAKSRNSNRNDE